MGWAFPFAAAPGWYPLATHADQVFQGPDRYRDQHERDPRYWRGHEVYLEREGRLWWRLGLWWVAFRRL